LHYICTIKTPEQDRSPDGTKRVYTASAYALMVDIKDTPLSEEILRNIFQSGDDASGIYISDITQNFDPNTPPQDWIVPPFGLDHHETLYRRMIERLNEIYFYQPQ
jgi:hypothetical protein